MEFELFRIYLNWIGRSLYVVYNDVLFQKAMETAVIQSVVYITNVFGDVAYSG